MNLVFVELMSLSGYFNQHYDGSSNQGRLLYKSHDVDNRCKRSLLTTLLNRAQRLSSSSDLFAAECDNLKEIFLKLKYPERLINLLNMWLKNTARLKHIESLWTKGRYTRGSLLLKHAPETRFRESTPNSTHEGHDEGVE